MTRPPFARADTVVAFLVGCIAFALYARTACPTLAGGDSAELAAAAAVLGVPHPPGYPLYTLVTALWVRLLPVGDAAFAANLASGLYAAVALALLYVLVRRLGAGRAGALVAATCLGLGATFWSQSTVAEVYTLDAALFFATLVAAERALRVDSRAAWVVLGLACGSWLAHRTVNVVYLPALALAFLGAGGFSKARRHLAGAALGLGAALLVYLYLPIASAADPPIDIGDPETPGRFWVVLRGAPYTRHLGGASELAFGRLERMLAGLPRESGPGFALALMGAFAVAARSRAAALGAVLFAITGVGFAIRYNVLDVDVYFLPTYALLALLAGLGTDRLARGRAGNALAGLALVLALALAPWNFARCDQSRNRAVRRLGEDLLAAVDEGGVLFTEGDTSIHALWFLQAVEHRSPDVVVFSPGHLWPWYLEQLAERHPELSWPEPEGEVSADHTRLVLARLIEATRCYHTRSVDPGNLLRPIEGGPSFGSVPRGLTEEIRRKGESLSLDALASWNVDYFDRALEAFGIPLEHVDMDTKSVYLQYALSLFQAARLYEAAGRAEDARRAYQALLSFDPDRHERDVAADAWRGLRQRVPALELGRKAREALQRSGEGGVFTGR